MSKKINRKSNGHFFTLLTVQGVGEDDILGVLKLCFFCKVLSFQKLRTTTFWQGWVFESPKLHLFGGGFF